MTPILPTIHPCDLRIVSALKFFAGIAGVTTILVGSFVLAGLSLTLEGISRDA